MKKLSFIIRTLIFKVILSVLMSGYFYLIKPKFDADTWPTTTTVEGFYELEENSIDVLFIGSSHAVSSFYPNILEENYGLKAYNIGTAQQSPVVSYYMLEEALRYQSPEYVVMDCFCCFPVADINPLNQEESFSRSALDFMRWSPTKVGIVHDICTLDPDQSEISYYLPNIRYHSRWEDMSLSDLNRNRDNSRLGARALYYSSNIEFYGYDMYEGIPIWPMMPLMEEYLNRIVDLCQENNIELILTMTPTIERNIEQCASFELYAREHGLRYIDYNDRLELERIGYIFSLHCADTGHTNVRGAEIITNDIGRLITSN